MLDETRARIHPDLARDLTRATEPLGARSAGPLARTTMGPGNNAGTPRKTVVQSHRRRNAGNSMMLRLITCLFALVCCLAVKSTSAQSADVVTVGTNSGIPGASVDIPVYIRDTSGTPLGLDQPAGSRIESYSIKVDYSPAADVQSVTFARAGITAPLTPAFESMPSAPGSISLIDSFSESTNLIPFTLNAALPGDQIGVLHFVLAAGAAPGTITLTLDSALTQLGDQTGTVHEAVASSNLTLTDGSITVNAAPVRLQSFDVK